MDTQKTKIVRVTPCSIEKTYNMTMAAPYHNYFANGILTANSHSVSYGLLAYHTAYLKAHYPAHFWSAVLSNEIDNSDKVARYIDKAKQMGIEILPPDVNISFDTFTPQQDAIRFGLAAIKGLGLTTVSAIIAARQEGGPFRSLYDLTERVESRSINKRVLEGLIKAGAFDSLKKCEVAQWRARLYAAIDSALNSGMRAQEARNSGQVSLFGMFETANTATPEPELPAAKAWSQAEMLNYEKESVGFYLTGHPLEHYQQVLTEFASTTIEGLKSLTPNEVVKVGGIISSVTRRTTKKGDEFALCQLENQFSAVKVVIWPDVYGKIKSRPEKDRLEVEKGVLVSGRLEIEEEGAMSIIADDVQMLEGIRERNARQLLLRVKAAAMTVEKTEKLRELLDTHRGSSEIAFEVELTNLVAQIKPNPYVTINPSPELIASIKALCGECQIELKR